MRTWSRTSNSFSKLTKSSGPFRNLAKTTMCRLISSVWSMRIFLLHLALTPLLTLAYDASKRPCVGDNVCLTSFHWCAAVDGNKDDQTGCSFPEGAYPMTLNDKKQNAALFVSTSDYVISWKKGDPTNDNPVKITWHFGGGLAMDGTNFTWGPKWETSKRSCPRNGIRYTNQAQYCRFGE